MQQINQGTIQTYFVPYIKKILKDSLTDRRLQSIFRFDTVLKLQDKKSLMDEYDFRDSVLFENTELKRVFWDSFTSFVGFQKLIANGSAQKLALLLLPDEKGEFSKKALENISLFAFMAVKDFQTHLLRQEIDNEELNKEISRQKAADYRKKLEADKLLLARKKKEGAPFEIVDVDELERAIASSSYRDEFLGKYYTEYTEEGEKIITFTTKQGEKDKEKAVSLTTALELSFDSQAVSLEKELLGTGMVDLDGEGLKGDKRGTISGIVIDLKTNEKFKLDYNASQPEKPMYRLVSLLKPGKKLYIEGDKFKKSLKQDKSIGELAFEYMASEKKKSEKTGPSRVVAVNTGPPKPAEKSDTTVKTGGRLKEKPEQSAPGQQPDVVVAGQINTERNLSFKRKMPKSGLLGKGVIGAKQQFAARNKDVTKGIPQPNQATLESKPQIVASKGAIGGVGTKRKKNPIMRVLKGTGIATGLIGGAAAAGATAQAAAAAGATTVICCLCNIA